MARDEILEAEFQRAIDRRDLHDFAGAREILEELAEEHPGIFGIWLVLGGVQVEQLDYEAAEESFSMATLLGPHSELASLALFHTLNHLGRANDAYAEMRRFLALHPESHDYDLLRQEIDEE